MRRLIDDGVGWVDVKCVYAPVENGAFSCLTVYILVQGVAVW